MSMDRIRLVIRRSFSGEEREGIRQFLGHKGEPWMKHVEDFLNHGEQGVRDGLEWRFYLAMQGERMLSNICIWENRTVGILGHVFTIPEARGRGIAKQLMAFALEDFDKRGGTWLQLNVEPDSFQEKFYGKSGFRQIGNLPGAMYRSENEPDLKVCHNQAKIEKFCWGHLPHWNRFFLSVGENGKHFHRGFSVSAPFSLEYPMLQLWSDSRLIDGIACFSENRKIVATGTLTRSDDSSFSYIDVFARSSVPHSDLRRVIESLSVSKKSGIFDIREIPIREKIIKF